VSLRPRPCLVVPLLAALLWGCPDPDATVDAGAFDRAEFDFVNPVLLERCGSLDCHGDGHRNYRLYGFGGRRLSAEDRPDAEVVRADEVDANYDATLALEPEITARIADGETEAIGELTLVRKARGAEAHDGGAPFTADGPGERCLVSWLAGRVDSAACEDELRAP
jgi:hypothetical protein